MFKTNCCRYRSPEYGYNMTDGGRGSPGHKFSEETKNKMSKSRKNPSEETRRKISEANKNPSKETRMKMSLSQKGRFSNPKNNPMYGKHHTEEARQKMRSNHTDVSGANNPNYGNHKCAGANNPKARKVIRLSDMTTYDYLNKAAQENNVSKNTMIKYCSQCKDFMYYEEWLAEQKDLEVGIIL